MFQTKFELHKLSLSDYKMNQVFMLQWFINRHTVHIHVCQKHNSVPKVCEMCEITILQKLFNTNITS